MGEDMNIGNEEVIKDILQAINSIKYGYVQIVVQDSRVVQIDKTEKVRLETKRPERR